MEEKFKKLDDFLRKHLSDASEDRNWNIPDDAVFEKAMRTVAEQKKKNRRGWLLIPILFGVGLVVSEYFHHRQIETLQGKITTLEENLARESSATHPLSSTSSNRSEESSSTQATTSNETQEKNSIAPANESSPNARLTQNSTASFSHPSNHSSIPSESNKQSLDNRSTTSKSLTQTKDVSKTLTETVSNSDQAKSTELPTKPVQKKLPVLICPKAG
jgi:hypothetical protein